MFISEDIAKWENERMSIIVTSAVCINVFVFMRMCVYVSVERI